MPAGTMIQPRLLHHKHHSHLSVSITLCVICSQAFVDIP